MSSNDGRSSVRSGTGERASSKNGARPSSRAKKSVCTEERRTKVTNTSKHIYKPSFALPKKEAIELE
jgi:hypothetical protein